MSAPLCPNTQLRHHSPPPPLRPHHTCHIRPPPPLPRFVYQIVQFILQNTSSKAATLDDIPITGGFCDPFTGGGRGESAPPPSRPPQQQAAAAGPIPLTGGFCDPFTGGAAAGASSSRTQLPARVYLLFDSPPPAEGLRKKLLEFNAALADSPELGPAALITQQEAAAGGGLQ